MHGGARGFADGREGGATVSGHGGRVRGGDGGGGGAAASLAAAALRLVGGGRTTHNKHHRDEPSAYELSHEIVHKRWFFFPFFFWGG